MKKIIDSIIKGIGISFIVTNIMMLIFATDAKGIEVIQVYFLWMIAGAIFGVISLIYINNKLYQLAIHFILTALVALSSTWFMLKKIFVVADSLNLLSLFSTFFIIYVILILIHFAYEKYCINELNKKLK